MSLQHLQEVRGEHCFYLALLAKLAPKSQFQKGCEKNKGSSKEGQKNDPGLKKESSALASRHLSSSAHCREALQTAAAFRVIANPLVCWAEIMLFAINYQDLVTPSTWMMNYTHT